MFYPKAPKRTLKATLTGTLFGPYGLEFSGYWVRGLSFENCRYHDPNQVAGQFRYV